MGMLVASLVVAACTGGGGATSTPAVTVAPTPVPATAAPTAAATAAPTAAATPAASATAAAIELPPAELSSIKIGISTLDPDSFLMKWAQDSGAFKKYGLDAEVSFFDGQAVATALHARQIDIANNTVTQAILALLTPDPVVEIAITTNGFRDILFSSPDVATGEQLKGKRVAISQFGGQSHAEVVVALKSLGLTPEDVEITQIGGQSARLAALQSGNVQAAPADPGNETELVAAGLHPLVRLEESTVPFAGSDVEVLREWLTKNPNTALRVVAAVLEAQQTLYSQSDAVVASYAAWAQLSAAEAADTLSVFLASPVGQRDLRWTKEGFENNIPVLVTINPDIASADVTQAYDISLLDKLKDMGFNHAIGVPGY
jgi:ABC-type nitrate/sulfonate/bicarbonate transport system substrate-binding protein